MTKAIQKLRPFTGVILAALGAAAFVFLVGDAAAQTAITPVDNPVSDLTGGEGSLRALVLTLINFFLTFLGLLAVAIIIYGGFLYVSSAGNTEKTDQAKKIITYAAIGIVVILISFALVNTLLTAGQPGNTGQ